MVITLHRVKRGSVVDEGRPGGNAESTGRSELCGGEESGGGGIGGGEEVEREEERAGQGARSEGVASRKRAMRGARTGQRGGPRGRAGGVERRRNVPAAVASPPRASSTTWKRRPLLTTPATTQAGEPSLPETGAELPRREPAPEAASSTTKMEVSGEQAAKTREARKTNGGMRKSEGQNQHRPPGSTTPREFCSLVQIARKESTPKNAVLARRGHHLE